MKRQVGFLKSSNRMQSKKTVLFQCSLRIFFCMPNVDDILSAEISNVGGDSQCGHDADRCQNLLVL